MRRYLSRRISSQHVYGAEKEKHYHECVLHRFTRLPPPRSFRASTLPSLPALRRKRSNATCCVYELPDGGSARFSPLWATDRRFGPVYLGPRQEGSRRANRVDRRAN